MGEKRTAHGLSVRIHGVLLALVCAAYAHAGIAPAITDSAAQALPANGQRLRPIAPLSVAARCVLPPAHEPSDAAANGPDTSGGLRIAALPAAPNSITLVLSALVAFGAIQGTRSLARLGATTLPDWYHSGAPAQIGHIKLFDFFETIDEPVFCVPALVSITLERPQLDARPPPSESFIPTRAPRSPPAVMTVAQATQSHV